MNTILKYSGVVALVIIAILTGKALISSNGVSFGSTSCDSYTCFTYLEVINDLKIDATATYAGLASFTGGVKVGSSGTTVNGLNYGICYIQASATTISASSTVTVDCQASTSGANTALTGITAGDTVFVKFATTTSTTFAGLSVLGASASSTSGYITMKVYNGTGGTFTWTSGASTTNYVAYR